MKIVVLLCGVADPKWPLRLVGLEAAKTRAANPVVLNPFEESALEIGLKIREGRSGTTLHAFMVGGSESEPLVRKIAAYRLDSVARIDAATMPLWDSGAMAKRLAATIGTLEEKPDLVLIGREFGDYDDGIVAPCLAASLGWSFFGLTQHARWSEQGLGLYRERRNVEEWLVVGRPVVASVTNDRRSRLRHPMMKNVMEAKRMAIPIITIPEGPAGGITLTAVEHAPPRAREVACRILDGPIEAQVAELAEYIQPWKRRS